MKHCMMYYAGYRHLSCDKNTHTHTLLNLNTNELELWKTCRHANGIRYKNTSLKFIKFINGGNYEQSNNRTNAQN
jgi:hypothetical protein